MRNIHSDSIHSNQNCSQFSKCSIIEDHLPMSTLSWGHAQFKRMREMSVWRQTIYNSTSKWLCIIIKHTFSINIYSTNNSLCYVPSNCICSFVYSRYGLFSALFLLGDNTKQMQMIGRIYEINHQLHSDIDHKKLRFFWLRVSVCGCNCQIIYFAVAVAVAAVGGGGNILIPAPTIHTLSLSIAYWWSARYMLYT